MQTVKSRKIAITGSMGSGKSLVASFLKEAGFSVFSADECNRLLLEKPEVLSVLETHFQAAFENHRLNKALLREMIFSDENLKTTLEGIMLPKILACMLDNMNQTDLFFAELPTLFESKWEGHFDEIIVVVRDEDLIIEELSKKGYSEGDLKKTWLHQMSVAQKIENATLVLYNNKTPLELKDALLKWIGEKGYG